MARQTDRLSIALAQLNPLVGDIEGNTMKALAAREEAAAAQADIVVFSELFLVGYPPEDLVLKPAFQLEVSIALEKLILETKLTPGPALMIGLPWVKEGQLYNACMLIDDGHVVSVSSKYHLPNYGVFDELRIFAQGAMSDPVNFRGVRLGVLICEDMWFTDVAKYLQKNDAEILLVPNGSPFTVTKADVRLSHAAARVSETGLPLIYVNQLGGQDELVFDGASFVLNADGACAVQLPRWEEKVTTTHWKRDKNGWVCQAGEKAALEEGIEAIYLAAMLGLRDYVEKNRFPGVVLGFSGGIDSALSAAIATDALGADRVHCVMMPSDYTSQESLEDAARCATALGAPYDTIPIAPAVKAYETMLAPSFAGAGADTTEENIQSRVRAVLLMALSNKLGNMVLTTGNKSEMSVGYATLYGDMCGGYNVLKDIYKSQVFKMAGWRNQNKPKGGLGPEGLVVPQNIIDKPPTAELRENQKDEDSLPPYEVLDEILMGLVEKDMSVNEVVASGFDRDLVKRIEHLLFIAEYKRRQAPPGVKVGCKNFGRDRRYPITNGFRNAK